MANRDYDFGKRIQRSNAKAEADAEAVREAVRELRTYGGLMQCERCHTEQDYAPECRVCGQEAF